MGLTKIPLPFIWLTSIRYLFLDINYTKAFTTTKYKTDYQYIILDKLRRFTNLEAPPRPKESQTILEQVGKAS